MTWQELESVQPGDLLLWGSTTEWDGELDLILSRPWHDGPNQISFRIWDSLRGERGTTHFRTRDIDIIRELVCIRGGACDDV